jgi:protein gp37
MSTNIEWVRNPDGTPGETWNPVVGCSKVSAGCKHCYAERWHQRFFSDKKFTDVRCLPERLSQPLHWQKPRTIFVNSMSDLFHEAVPDEFIDWVFAVMARTQEHTYQVLTKRPERMRQFCQNWNSQDLAPWPMPNVWLGVSVEDQATAEERIPWLLETPAAVRFVSCEPLLGPIDLNVEYGQGVGDLLIDYLNWVIVGGESGPKARPMHPDWARSIRDQCVAAGVPFFFKQWGEWEIASISNGHRYSNMAYNGASWVDINGKVDGPSSHAMSDDAYAMVRVGKKHAGRVLDGCTWDEMPQVNP